MKKFWFVVRLILSKGTFVTFLYVEDLFICKPGEGGIIAAILRLLNTFFRSFILEALAVWLLIFYITSSLFFPFFFVFKAASATLLKCST